MEHDALKRFFADTQTQEILYRPLSPYTKPTPQTKSTFETKTSAINVSPTSNASYNIQEIKDDSLWLSQQTAVDEVSCLRIAILEWQTRAASELLHGGRTLEPPDNGAFSFTNGASLDVKNLEEYQQVLRRKRSTELLLSERTHILKCAEFIFAQWTCQQHEGSQPKQTGIPWLAEISQGMSLRWSLAKTTTKGKEPAQNVKRPAFILGAIDGIRSRLEALGVGSGWSGLEGEQESVEVSWGVCQAIEIVHILELLQDVLLASSSIVQAEIASAWFRLMADCAFFESFQLVSTLILCYGRC